MKLIHKFFYGELDRVLQKQARIVDDFQELFETKPLLPDVPRVIGVYNGTHLNSRKAPIAQQKHQEYYLCDEQLDPDLIAVVYNPEDFRVDYHPEEFNQPKTLQQLINKKSPSARVRALDVNQIIFPGYFTRKPVLQATQLSEQYTKYKQGTISLPEYIKFLQQQHSYYSFAKREFGLTLQESMNKETIQRAVGYFFAIIKRKS